MDEHLHNDELRQRLANAERERDQLRERLGVSQQLNRRAAEAIAGLRKQVGLERARVRERDEMLTYRLGQYLELKAVLDLRQELGAPDAITKFYPGAGS